MQDTAQVIPQFNRKGFHLRRDGNIKRKNSNSRSTSAQTKVKARRNKDKIRPLREMTWFNSKSLNSILWTAICARKMPTRCTGMQVVSVNSQTHRACRVDIKFHRKECSHLTNSALIKTIFLQIPIYKERFHPQKATRHHLTSIVDLNAVMVLWQTHFCLTEAISDVSLINPAFHTTT